MKRSYAKKDGTIKQYVGNYKSVNDLDYLCDIYNDMNNFTSRQIGSLEVHKDAYGSRVVRIGNSYGGCFILKEGTQAELVDFVRVLIKNIEQTLIKEEFYVESGGTY